MKPNLTLEEIKDYYSHPKRIVPSQVRQLHTILANHIVSLSPAEVFEFGCNHGLNLDVIRKLNPSIVTRGCDINSKAVELAKGKGHKVEVGDEKYLQGLSSNLMFTSSVLNHIPDIDDIIKDLKYAAFPHVVLMEAISIPKGRRWFSHDYESYGFTLHCTVESEQAGATYGLFSWSRQ